MESLTGKTRPSPFLVGLAAITVLGTLLRVGVLAAIPNFYGPGDPSLYYSMALSIANGEGPKVGFIRHYWTWPENIVHLEDFYEPAYGAMLATFLLIFGKKILAAKLLALLAGIGSIVASGLIARRLANWKAGLWAAAIVAFHPYSIYYSGLIMKEVLVGLLLLWLWDWGSTLFESERPAASKAVAFGAAAGLAGTLQYESMPIMVAGVCGVLLLWRRRAAWPVFGGMAAVWIPLLLVTWHFIGVPISTKFSYFLGLSEGMEGNAAGMRLSALWGLIPPVPYTPKAILGNLEFTLTLLAGYQWWVTRGTMRSRLFLGLFLAFVYFHSVPYNLWTRDFLSLTPRLAVFAGISLSQLLAHVSVRQARLPTPLLESAALVMLLGSFHAYTGFDEIYRNPEFPGYEASRARREAIGKTLAVLPAGAAIMTDEMVEETWLYSGHPVVRIPNPYDFELMKQILRRYGISHLLLAAFTPNHDWRPIVGDLPVRKVDRIGDPALGQYFLVELAAGETQGGAVE